MSALFILRLILSSAIGLSLGLIGGGRLPAKITCLRSRDVPKVAWVLVREGNKT